MSDKAAQKIDRYLYTAKAFHLEMPLYHKIDLAASEEIEGKMYFAKILVHSYINTSEPIDAYCIYCKKDSVFHLEDRSNHSTLEKWDTWAKYEEISMKCSRDSTHIYTIFYLKSNQTYRKVGQFPSTADFQIPQAEKYRKILGENDYKEFTRGIGLAANGVGIGSFVYLRRIFENLIEGAHKVAVQDKGFSEEKYIPARMDEKISLLKNHLPDFLVENKSIYRILSKGLHKLTEEDCLKYFAAVKIGIEQILDEKIEQQEKARKAELARAAIQGVHDEISTTNDAEEPGSNDEGTTSTPAE